jgi:hypothetical protein
MKSRIVLSLVLFALSLGSLPLAEARTRLATRAAAAPTSFTISADAPSWQAKTPAQVVGFVYGDNTLFSGIIVFNSGTSALTEVQIGCFLEGLPAGVANPVDLGFVPFGTGPVEIAPNTLGLVTLAPMTVDDISSRFDGRAFTDVIATLGVVNARWANGKRFAAPDISNGFRTQPNARIAHAFAELTATQMELSLDDLTSIYNWPVIVSVPDDDDFYYCKTITGWRCLSRVGENECAGSIKCSGCTSSTSRKCVKLALVEPPPV